MSRPASRGRSLFSRFLLATFLLFSEGTETRAYRREGWRAEARPPAAVLVVGEATPGLSGRGW